MAVFEQVGGSNGGNYARYFTGRLTVTEESYSIENNTSYVYYKLELVSGSSGRFSTYSASYSVTLDGSTVNSGSGTYNSQSYNTAQTICEGYTTISHNSDGTKSISCSAALDFASGTYSPGDFYPSGTYALSTIPRASILYAADGRIDIAAVKFTIDRKSSGFTDSIYYINPANNQETLIVNKTSQTTYYWSPPSSLYASFPNATGIYLTFKSYTYNGSTLVGSDTAHASVWANESASRPTVSVTATPTNYSSLTGSATTLIKYISNVAISVTATKKNNAGSITKIVTNGTTLSTNSTTGSKTFSAVQTNTFTTTATDSRGYTTNPADVKTFTMVNYVPLTVTPQVARVSATSSTVKATIRGNYFNGSFGSQNNTLTLTWKYKLRTASSWTTGGTLTTTLSGNTYTTGEVTLGTSFDYDKDYNFLFTAVDKIYTSGVSSDIPINRGAPIFEYGVDGNGANYFNVNGEIYKNNKKTTRDCITMMLSSDCNCSTLGSYTKVTGFSQTCKYGTRLSFSNNQIVVGAGVSKVKVSAKLGWYCVTGSIKYAYIMKSNTVISWSTINLPSGAYGADIVPEILVDVAQGDTFSMKYYADNSGDSLVATMRTYMTVEVVE